MKVKNIHTKETVEKIKEYYLSNDVSLQDMSDNSVSLFGKQIPLADLKFLSRSDPNGAWSVIKSNNGRKTSDVPMQEKLNNVANKLYEIMFDEDTDLSATQLAQLAKTWSDLVDKAKLGKGETTSKSTAQQAKDLFAKTMAELEGK